MENINEYHRNIRKPKNLRETIGEESFQRMMKRAQEVDKRLAEKEAIKKSERKERASLRKIEKDKKECNNSDECSSNR